MFMDEIFQNDKDILYQWAMQDFINEICMIYKNSKYVNLTIHL